MYRIGVDLGGTNIAAGLVDEEYRIIRKGSSPTRAAERTAEEIVDAIAELCRRLVREEGLSMEEIVSVGVASPGVVDHDKGTVVCAYNLPFRNFPLADLLRERLRVPAVHAENDANAAAWGEYVAGALKGAKNSVMITLGTGVGGGVIVDGKVFSGFNYGGAELGHMVIETDGASCTCGRRGCWEAYSSASALVRMTREKLEECRKTGRETVMEELVAAKGKVSGKTSFEAMRRGDAAGREVVEEYLHYLSVGLGNIINIFQPEVLAIGGGISNEKDNLIRPLLPLVRKEQFGVDLLALTRLCTAELGNDAGIIGAAYLGID